MAKYAKYPEGSIIPCKSCGHNKLKAPKRLICVDCVRIEKVEADRQYYHRNKDYFRERYQASKAKPPKSPWADNLSSQFLRIAL